MENLTLHNLLSEEEIAKPTLVLKKLLVDTASIEHLRLDLWEWVKAALAQHPWQHLESPGTTLFLQEHFNRLLSALHLLMNTHEFPSDWAESDEQQEFRYLQQFEDLFCQYRGHIRRLRFWEIDDPYLAIKACFEFHGIEEWYAVFKEWTEFALSNLGIAETGPEILILAEYEQLEKMLEAAYLLIGQQHQFPERLLPAYWSGLQQALHPFLKGERQVSIELLRICLQFLDTVPPERLNRNIRNIFLDYLTFNSDGFPLDFNDYLFDLEQLHHFLDTAVRETHHWKRE